MQTRTLSTRCSHVVDGEPRKPIGEISARREIIRIVSFAHRLAAEDGESIPGGTTLKTDVAIVGAGAAGITLARELTRTSIATLLIESGGPEVEDRYQELSEGEIVGTPYWPLDGNRQRCLGGTTNHWSGWCRPLDDLDLARRDWVPRSGWPITRDSLDPYYTRAHEVCELGSLDYDVATWEGRLNGKRLQLDNNVVTTRMFQLSPPTHFGAAYVPDLERSGNVRIVFHATVLEIEAPADGRVVTALHVGTLSGRRFRVEARNFVLAAGALENARLLLLSDRHRPAGLGNRHDQVGRYFMEHLHFTFGRLTLRCERSTFDPLYSPLERRSAVGRLFVVPDLQRKHGLLHGNVMLSPSTGSGSSRWHRRAERLLQRRRRHVIVTAAHTIEQPPELSNRVTLAAQRDVFGLRRIRLEWRVGEMERLTFRRNWQVISEAIGSAGIGKARLGAGETEQAWPPDELQGMRGHHMGTTRMSIDPRNGVVDTDCRVHGLGNLFIAGSGVFPTAGAGTPTLTIIALALRLADHLRSRHS